jgi:alpha-L-rhamnosidase
MDVAAFFTKWLVDLEDAQTEEGAFPNVAPRKGAMEVGVSGWGDAGIICPWTIWKAYGDTRVIEAHYDAMVKWLAYLHENSDDFLRQPKGFGDWLSVGEETPKDVIGTAYFAYSASLLSEMAWAIGKPEDALKYRKLFEDVKSAFNKAYVSDDGKIKGDTQTAYVLALHFGLLDGDWAKPAAQHLVKAIERQDWHLSTGFVGLSYLCPVLTDSGNLDVAYKLLNNDTYPSWLYPVKNGATTIWERWDGWTEKDGFQDPGMNSFNHYAYGSIGQWLFSTVAGIQPATPGYKKITIRPRPGGGLTWVNSEYDSIYGRIASRWKIEDGNFKLNVAIPCNTEAEIYLPAGDKQAIKESGRAVREAEGVEFLREQNGAFVYRALAGVYSFELPYTPTPLLK